MYLLYVDESGLPGGRQGDHFVLTGMALHEEDCYPLAKSLDAAQRRVLPGPDGDLELHASRIYSARNEWSHVSAPDRLAVLDTAFELLGNWHFVTPSGASSTVTVRPLPGLRWYAGLAGGHLCLAHGHFHVFAYSAVRNTGA